MQCTGNALRIKAEAKLAQKCIGIAKYSKEQKGRDKLKAHIPNRREIERKLEISEIHRINKLWLYTLGRTTNLSHKKIREVYQTLCDISVRIYEDPEYWLRVDEFCLDTLKLKEFIPAENYDEREKVAAQIHAENGKKWRKY